MTAERDGCEYCGGDVVPGSTCPRGVPCPVCGAPAGRRCRRPSGHVADVLHRSRIALAEQLDRERGIAYPTPTYPELLA